mmetsp:Transcript_10920/g.23257  ORF Transcript_10920/g.23257 Transcript_10920/m.23257 type:complete len:205 (-) Transcript_10920:2176-2790(-)
MDAGVTERTFCVWITRPLSNSNESPSSPESCHSCHVTSTSHAHTTAAWTAATSMPETSIVEDVSVEDDDAKYEYSACSKLRFAPSPLFLLVLALEELLEDLFPLLPLPLFPLKGGPVTGNGASLPVLPRAEGRLEGRRGGVSDGGDDDDGAPVPVLEGIGVGSDDRGTLEYTYTSSVVLLLLVLLLVLLTVVLVPVARIIPSRT